MVRVFGMNLQVRKAWWIALVAVGATGFGLLLYFFAPDQYGLFPRCAFHTLTGLQCPGCGGLRCLHQLLHGHFAAAFRYNPLLVTMLPLSAAGLGYYVSYRLLEKPLPKIWQHPAWLWLLTGAVVLFGIGRNLSFVSLGHI